MASTPFAANDAMLLSARAKRLIAFQSTVLFCTFGVVVAALVNLVT
jgi:hypothetical protein